MTARWRKFSPALRHTPEYRRLSRPPPNARTLIEWCVTGDCTTPIPGLFCCGRLALFEQLGWSGEPEALLQRVWNEAIESGLLQYDPETRLCFLPWMCVEEYLPDQPNSLLPWGPAWAELPDCQLKHAAWLAFRDAFVRRPRKRRDKDSGKADGEEATAYARVFAQVCPEPRMRSLLQSEGNNEGNSDPHNEGNKHRHKHGNSDPHAPPSPPPSVAGSRAPSARGSLSGEGEREKRSEGDGEGESPRGRARSKSEAGQDAEAVQRAQILAAFGERAGDVLGIDRPNPYGTLGMPQLESTLFMAAFQEAVSLGWTLDDFLVLSDWLHAGGAGWHTGPKYQYLAKTLIPALSEAKKWAAMGRPELDERGRPKRKTAADKSAEQRAAHLGNTTGDLEEM